jgi:hypothetical protein
LDGEGVWQGFALDKTEQGSRVVRHDAVKLQ